MGSIKDALVDMVTLLPWDLERSLPVLIGPLDSATRQRPLLQGKASCPPDHIPSLWWSPRRSVPAGIMGITHLFIHS